ASTRAIESFQRNPNGGTSSSIGNAYGAEREKAIRPARRIRRFVGRLELPIQFSRQLVISACIGCIFNSPSSPSGILRARKLRPQTIPVNSGVPHGIQSNQSSSPRQNRPEQSFSLGHARFVFLVKKIFLGD